METPNVDQAEKSSARDEEMAKSLMKGIAGYLYGRVAAWVDPFAIPKEIKHIRKNGIQGLSDYALHLAGAVGYFEGLYNILSDVIKDPHDARNYVPIAINGVILASAGINWVFERGKKQGKLEAELSNPPNSQ
jgi:hypothetical protein